MARVNGERAIVLHVRPYRETSAIVQFFTENHGRLAGVARGVRGTSQRNRLRTQLQPFREGRLNFSGRGSLVNITGFDATTYPTLTGNRLATAFYVIELLSRLTGERESDAQLYRALSVTMTAMTYPELELAPVLRRFEKQLLQELGYGFDFGTDARSGMPLNTQASYQLVAQVGFVECSATAENAIPGSVLRAIDLDQYTQTQVERTARRIFRSALAALLGPKPLISRQMVLRGSGAGAAGLVNVPDAADNVVPPPVSDTPETDPGDSAGTPTGDPDGT